MPAAAIDVVVLKKHCRRQDDISEFCRVGHELLMHDQKEILALEAFDDLALLGRDIGWIGVLHQHGSDRRATVQRFGVTGQHPADLRLVEPAQARIKVFTPLEQRLV